MKKFHAGSQNINHKDKKVWEDFCNYRRMSCKKFPRAFYHKTKQCCSKRQWRLLTENYPHALQL